MGVESIETSFKLQDRTAILTGPCNSYNQAIALKLTQLGANVAMIDRNIDKMERFANQMMDTREVYEKYGRAIAIQADLSKLHHVQDAISRAAESFGGADIFVDGLMITEPKAFKDPKSLDDLDRIIDVNLRSPMMATHAVLRFLEGRKRGRIIYLIHDLARLGFVNNSLLSVTRTGLSAFARTLAREVAENKVTVNCIAIGVTEDLLLAQGGNGSIQEAQNQLTKTYPHAMMTEPERIANMVAFLASPMSAGITGQTLAVSQGLSFLS